MSILDEYNEEVHERVRAILAEHFPYFMFCVMDEGGSVYYDYTNVPVGKMLLREMQASIDGDTVEINWEYEEEDDENGSTWE